MDATMIKRDEYYNDWTYDWASRSWQDEYGGKLKTDPSYMRIGRIHSPHSKLWGMEYVQVWTNNAGEVQRKKPAGSQGWRNEYMQIWASSAGDITAGWPSRHWRGTQANASTVKWPGIAKYDPFFNK